MNPPHVSHTASTLQLVGSSNPVKDVKTIRPRSDPPTALGRVGGSVSERNRIGGSVFAAEDDGKSAAAR